MIHSTVQHFRLTTTNLPEMVSWYARVFGLALPATRPRRREERQPPHG